MDPVAESLDWIALDWGTSNCRAWAMSAAGDVLAEARSTRGMGELQPGEFEGALLDMVGSWMSSVPVTVIACGMVGSRQGWVEAPYQTVPSSPVPQLLHRARAKDPRLSVWVLPGLKQNDPPDVMRGEETQIAGFLSTRPDFDGVLCLPGSHSKWVHVSAGEVVSFRSFLTGEMFAALSEQTVLRHSLDSDWNDAAFQEALADALSKPEALAQNLFAIRASQLLTGLGPGVARSRLSGLLIGAELAAARPYWLGQETMIIGDEGSDRTYARALAAQGAGARRVDADLMTRKGLAAALAQQKVAAT